jgi:hypothetical protein
MRFETARVCHSSGLEAKNSSAHFDKVACPRSCNWKVPSGPRTCTRSFPQSAT